MNERSTDGMSSKSGFPSYPIGSLPPPHSGGLQRDLLLQVQAPYRQLPMRIKKACDPFEGAWRASSSPFSINLPRLRRVPHGLLFQMRQRNGVLHMPSKCGSLTTTVAIQVVSPPFFFSPQILTRKDWQNPDLFGRFRQKHKLLIVPRIKLLSSFRSPSTNPSCVSSPQETRK